MNIINAFLKANYTTTFTANERLVIIANISNSFINADCATSICLNGRYVVCHFTSLKLPTVICRNICTIRCSN